VRSAEEWETYDADEEIQFRRRVRLHKGFDDNCDADPGDWNPRMLIGRNL
jgi:hypothetical protein